MRLLALLLFLIQIFSCKSRIASDNVTNFSYQAKATPGIVFFLYGNGENWIEKNEGLPESTKVSSIAVDEKTIGILSKEKGVFTFDFKKNAWEKIHTDSEIIEKNPTAIAFFKNHIYVGTQLGGVYYTKDMGKNWSKINQGLDNLTVRRFSDIGEKLFVGTNGGLFSLNGNATNWELEYGKDNLQVNGITEIDGSIYIGTTQGIFTSPIEKKEWENLLSNFALHNISSDDTHIYAMTYNELFSSVDKGRTWQSLQKGLPKELYTFNVIKNGNWVYAGQWDGVYKKNIEFGDWEHFSNGLPVNLSINNMKLYQDIIVVSGNERGLRKGMTTDR